MLNNLGIGRFWCFMEKSRTIDKNQPRDRIQSQLKPYTKLLEQGIKDLKQSVIEFESFHDRFNKELKEGKITQIKLKQTLFVNEFFNTEIKETLPSEFEHYNLQDNQFNSKFLSELFQKGESCLPLSNLGEISMIFGKMKEALAYLDISLKVTTSKDPTNLIKHKIIAELSGIVDLMGQTNMMVKMNSNTIQTIKDVDDYIKVFVLRHFGYLLMRHKQHEEEGKEYVDKADSLEVNYPYWSERKMSLFTPMIPHEPLEQTL